MSREGRQRDHPVTAYDAAVTILRRLREAGHTAFLAGGCVRDALLGLEPTDYDVATDARPDLVRRLFRRSRYVGEAFGVVLVRLGEHEVEVATFRTESSYSDGRHPDEVEFSDAEHDASRRDFTVNGLFADPLAVGEDPQTIGRLPLGPIIDYVGGVADLEAGVIRAIGDPEARFAEDYLRMLRAVRFAARLGFEVEGKTAAAIPPLAHRLGHISRERIGMEVTAMMHPPARARVGVPEARVRAVSLMQTLRLDSEVLGDERREREPRVLGGLPAEASLSTTLAAWMLDRYADLSTAAAVESFVYGEAPERIGLWRGALCLSNDVRDALAGILRAVARAIRWPELPVAGRKRLLAEPVWSEARKLLHVRGTPWAGLAETLEAESAPLLAEGVAPCPLIDGNDLIAAGLKPGPAFGRWLEGVYDAQLEGRVQTREDALRWVAERSRHQ